MYRDMIFKFYGVYDNSISLTRNFLTKRLEQTKFGVDYICDFVTKTTENTRDKTKYVIDVAINKLNCDSDQKVSVNVEASVNQE